MTLRWCFKISTNILVKGKIWTGQANNPYAEAFLVSGGCFLCVGDYSYVKSLSELSKCDFFDEGDDLVIPGMSDAHIHLTAQAKQDIYVNLADSLSIEDAMDRLRSQALDLPAGTWVRGINYNEENWREVIRPTRELLDRLGPNRPLLVSRYCGHVHVANTEALQRSGLWHSEDINVVRDDRGLPSGVLNEGAAGAILTEIVAMYETPDRVESMLAKTCAKLSSLGITAAHVCDVPSYALEENLTAYQALEEAGRLPLRIICFHDALPNYSFRSGFGSPLVRFGGLKLFCDGSIGGRTAALSAPYSDDPSTAGQLNHSDEGLCEQVRRAHRRGIQVQIHVIGDRAIDQALRVLSQVTAEEGKPTRPYRLNHMTYCPQHLIEKARDLGVVIDAQPAQPFRNRHMAPARLGAERIPFAYAYRRFLDAGILLTGSSDGPIEDINPWTGIWAAVNRTDELGFPMRYSPPDDRLSLDEALRMYTTNPWEALGCGAKWGKIVSGARADFTVLKGDPFKIPVEELKDVRHRRTFLDGRCVWEER